jgi:uncharacterized protein with PQ loop repeat
MDDKRGFPSSWAGFNDYTGCFHSLEPVWIVFGTGIFLGSGLSIVPQIFRVSNRRTSFGISPIFATITSATQVLPVINWFCLHNAAFSGLLQVPASQTIPYFIAWATLFILWFAYLPLVFLTFIFFDRNARISKGRTLNAIEREWLITLSLPMCVVFFSLTAMIIYDVVGVHKGFGSNTLEVMGRVYGVLAAGLTLFQYAPQFWTVFKLKDNGSFSLVTLAIQAPGGTLSVIFMLIGNKEDWSSVASNSLAALQQWFLLALCLCYKVKRHCARPVDLTQLYSVDSTHDRDRGFLDPQPLLRKSPGR